MVSSRRVLGVREVLIVHLRVLVASDVPVRGHPKIAFQGYLVVTHQLREAPEILLLVAQKLLEHRRVEVASPPWHCRVPKHRVVLVGLEGIRLGEPKLEHECNEAEDEKGRKEDRAYKNGEQETFLLLKHLDVGLSPGLGNCLVLDHCGLRLLLLLVAGVR